MLVEFQNFSKETLSQNRANLNLSDSENPGKFSANMGCNNVFGEAKFNSDRTVKFSALGSTMMYCDKAMNLESAFQKALPMMTNYKSTGLSLWFSIVQDHISMIITNSIAPACYNCPAYFKN
ncbi:META domain-containing protein [Chryseobacterium sp. MP_3.2]|uniref:META domain-containing protein n=1 Tax=Chryseobacterium sp. MP_3.2 TaxID=3071712 RepID=UPI002E0A4086|nr:heat shock protein HslJ [Chryseobacterium sp. MP_3.2]